MKIASSLLTFVLQIWATAGIALKRLLTQKFLSLAAVSGLVIASAFILSVPLYAEATFFRLFREELLSGRENEIDSRPVDYAPLDFTFKRTVIASENLQWQDVTALDTYLSGDALSALGLPVESVTRSFQTDGYKLMPPYDPERSASQYALSYATLGFISPLENAVTLVSGAYPQPASLKDGDIVQVLASENFVQEFGVQIGETYTLTREGVSLPVYIVGIWRPINPKAIYWEVDANGLLLTDEQTYTNSVSAVVADELSTCKWTITASGGSLHASEIASLTKRITAIQAQVEQRLPKTTLIASPLEVLARYEQNVPTLTYLLFAFSVPILGLILSFIGLVAGLFVGQQRGEMAILRSRGASAAQVTGISLLQGAILGTLGLAGGIFAGYWITHGIGRARSFLDFSARGGLRVDFTPQVLGYGILGVALILVVQVLLPTLSAAANTIITYKQERARSFRLPWWQKYFIDFLLLIPAAYGYWMLNQQKRQALAGIGEIPNPLQNPLLLLVPALMIFSVALFTLRLVPRLMQFIGWSLRPTKNVGALMAARYLSRTPAFYSAPLVLLVLTLGLSAFTASLAQTLDSQLEKQMFYQTGSDLKIEELGTTFSTETSQNRVFTFRSIEEHLGIQGVLAASRVGRYKTSAATPNGATEGTFLAIDRLSFAQVAYWQDDFARQNLAELLNALGAVPNGVLVPQGFLDQYGLAVGDSITLGIQPGIQGQSIPFKAQVVGVFDLFPTWYPDSGFMFVGNLDELFYLSGAEYPAEVWMKTAPNADPEGIVYAVRGYSILLDPKADQTRLVENGLNTFVTGWSSADLNIRAEQRRPERQGLFGLLSVGFVASAILTVLGFLLYALFSFRRRFIEMGMLRAIGLSVGQMIELLAAELAFLILLGIGVGTGLGVFASNLFVPYLQIGTSAQAQFPPFQIVIAWSSIFQIYALFIVLFLAALGGLSSLLLRMKIFQAIKLGETS